MDIIDRMKVVIEDIEGIDRAKEEEVKSVIMDFLKINTSPSDEEMHDLAKKCNVDPDILEMAVYEIVGSFAGFGRAKENGFEESDADPKELRIGIRVESEHTNWPPMAKRIALDHLSEIPDYYTRLLKMEKEAGIDH